MPIIITLNGTRQELKDTPTVLDLLSWNNLKPELVAVEINGHVIPKKNYPTHTLNNDDKVEIVHFVGGG